MKPSTKHSAHSKTGKLQFASVLTETATEQNPSTPVVRLQSFRVPWARAKTAPDQSRSDELPAKAATANRTPAIPLQAAAFSGAAEASAPLRSGPHPNFELALEEIRHRLETKTVLLEEALQRFERFEHRFWGINE